MSKNLVLAGTVALAVSTFSSQSFADSTEDLIDALVTKGVLTEDEGVLLSKGRKAEKKKEGKVAFKNGFKLQSPDGNSSLKFAGRVQLDARGFGDVDGSSNKPDTTDIRRAYFGVGGTYNKYYGFKLNGSFGSSAKLDVAQFDLKYFKAAQLRFGQFKTSMSLEERTSSRFLNFTERSYVNNELITTAKQQGAMLFGTPTKGVNYSFAVVNGYGQNTDVGDAENDSFKYVFHFDTDIATMNKWKNKVFHLGFNYASHDADPSLFEDGEQKTLGRGQTFFDLVKAGGVTEIDQDTFGFEFTAANGPFKLQAEYARTNIDSNLNDQDVDAYYLDAGWLISGESYSKSYKSKSDGGKFDRIKPTQDFNPKTFTGGALELMAGISGFDASDVTSSSAGFSIASTDTNEADSWRVGLKFMPDANTRFILNYIDTDFETPINSTNDNSEKAINIRAQYDF